MPPDLSLREQFIGGMSHAACTVNIVTTDGKAGRSGVTVSAMSPVSADTEKPTLLVCVHQQSAAASAILENGVFCVNILRDDQSYISDTFAGRFREHVEDKFDCTDWATQVTGSPRVVDPLVSFDCSVISNNKVGTHYVFFGEVEDIFVARSGSPLIYANRAYGSASRIDHAGSIQSGVIAANRKLSLGCVHTFGPYILPELIARLMQQSGAVGLNLVEGSQRRVQESLMSGEVEVALLYDLDLPEGVETHPLTDLHPYVLLAEGHPLTRLQEITPENLADQPMVLLNVSPSREYFEGILTDAGVTPNIVLRSSSFEMVRGMVGHGLGFTILGTRPASAMTYDGRAVQARPLVSAAGSSSVVMATRSGVELSATAATFAAECLDFFTGNA